MPVFRLPAQPVFPDVALAEPDGLLALGGDLSQERLLAAYRAGIFPWYSKGEPILWWSPDPRCVLFTDKIHRSRSMLKLLRQGRFRITLNADFKQVMQQCGRAPRPGQDGTWITPGMIKAYHALHQAGFAHSAEVWQDRVLVGGMYGVSLGSVFFGESMFSAVPNASKAALIRLAEHLQAAGFAVLDGQVGNPHLYRLGAVDIPRNKFLEILAAGLAKPAPEGCWPPPGQPLILDAGKAGGAAG
ncbi:MAG: leucyl/phenylalanyl-tRNA--protein transferase [Bacteroidetes bacterium]|nr:leucyl/phenylalanyl-tRNA--protein transferase [Bacteroidota bacterium]